MKKKFLKKNNGTWVLIATYALFTAVLVFFHEPWLDEAQAWLIARDAPSFFSMFQLSAFEASPMLWHTLLFPLANLGFPYFSMQILHWALAVAAVAIFVRQAPFNLLHKILVIFGYFMAYEYVALARSYVLLPLLLFAIAAFYGKRFEKPWLYMGLLFLLAQANLFGLLIVLSLIALYTIEQIFVRKEKFSRRQLQGLAVTGFGIVVAIFLLLPPSDISTHIIDTHSILSIDRLWQWAYILPTIFFPALGNQIHFWNNPWFYFHANVPIAVLALIAYLSFFWKAKWLPFIYFLFTTSGLMTFFFLKDITKLRHVGIFYILTIFGLWLSHYYSSSTARMPIFQKFRIQGRLNVIKIIFTIVLLLSTFSTGTAAYYEIKYNFSASKDVAEWLNQNYSERTLLAGYIVSRAEAILPYTPDNYPQIYSPGINKLVSYSVWTKEYDEGYDLSISEVTSRISTYRIAHEYDRVILVLTNPEEDDKFLQEYSLVASFPNTINDWQSFYVYEFRE